MSAAAATAISPKPASMPEAADPEATWQPFLVLPCQLTVEVPFPDFRVADFLALRIGSVVETHWNLARDLPLRVNGILIGWGELEGGANRMTLRLTELA
ncbi:MAG: FliM/FliN family flagellar motor C-terminal domain-containing protein [Candidatus Sulfotelmatobacter sp.]